MEKKVGGTGCDEYDNIHNTEQNVEKTSSLRKNLFSKQKYNCHVKIKKTILISFLLDFTSSKKNFIFVQDISALLFFCIQNQCNSNNVCSSKVFLNFFPISYKYYQFEETIEK